MRIDADYWLCYFFFENFYNDDFVYSLKYFNSFDYSVMHS